MHAFSFSSSSIFTFKLPLIPEPLGQRLIAVNMPDLHMPTLCLHKILACHHAVCPTLQKRNFSFHNKVGFQALEMKPGQDKGFTMWRKQLKHSKESGAIICFLLYEPCSLCISRHSGETSQRIKIIKRWRDPRHQEGQLSLSRAIWDSCHPLRAVQNY